MTKAQYLLNAISHQQKIQMANKCGSHEWNLASAQLQHLFRQMQDESKKVGA